ncbi:MAG: hypothetical protein HY810_06705 [Candidatus Omnitrophica bacterium]|nr:hypothetical protein [Candidatus Omnitrophota bacterium]
MKKWAWVVLLLCGLSILILTLPVMMVSFADALFRNDMNGKEFVTVFTCWPYWAGFILFLIAQAALLDIRVNTAEKRPVTKRNIIPVVLLSSLMMALLVGGIVLAIYETITKDVALNKWLILFLSASWFIWGVIFYKWGGKLEPESFLEKIRKCFFRGSILELLVAIPTHILARYRNYCCAGFNTFVGIVFGLAIMLCSFGPGVYFLFIQRWKSLHPDSNGE